MMLRWLVLAALLAAPAAAAPADPFALRIGAANALARTAGGAAYVLDLAPPVRAAIQACIPPGTAPPGSTGTFIFVADVTRAGAVMNGAVRPETAVSRCFAGHFGQERLNPPPLPVQVATYPIVVELDVMP